MIPDFQTLMLPVLQACAEGTLAKRDLEALLAERFDLSDAEREQRIASGTQTVLTNRVSWAKAYLRPAGLIHYPQRGYTALTEEGRRVLQDGPEIIDRKFLMRYEAGNQLLDAAPDDEATPDEALQQAYATLRRVLADELLERVRLLPPGFFERLIVKLLLAMGYGGAAADAGRTLGQSGDDGVDGVIDQDALGVDQVYVQAKRYQAGNNVGAGAIRDFFGALSLKKAQKGMFFTTSAFSADARRTAEELGLRIVLIDGERLAELMIDYDIGCREEALIRLKKVDEEFFPETEQDL